LVRTEGTAALVFFASFAPSSETFIAIVQLGEPVSWMDVIQNGSTHIHGALHFPSDMSLLTFLFVDEFSGVDPNYGFYYQNQSDYFGVYTWDSAVRHRWLSALFRV
jgi:hypothetical protein